MRATTVSETETVVGRTEAATAVQQVVTVIATSPKKAILLVYFTGFLTCARKRICLWVVPNGWCLIVSSSAAVSLALLQWVRRGTFPKIQSSCASSSTEAIAKIVSRSFPTELICINPTLELSRRLQNELHDSLENVVLIQCAKP